MTGKASRCDHKAVFRYTEKWRDVLHEFYNTLCRCEEVINGERCTNFMTLHLKGHQFARGKTSLLVGAFRSSFVNSIDDFVSRFGRELAQAAEKYCQPEKTKEWASKMWHNAKTSGIDSLFSNRTCLTCLANTPIHLLPCRHSVCDPCLVDLCHTESAAGCVMSLRRCPLGCSWAVPEWPVARKPREAGVRILSLDG